MNFKSQESSTELKFRVMWKWCSYLVGAVSDPLDFIVNLVLFDLDLNWTYWTLD